jgi:glycosyltransferase involved in cell wall biosynthesis
MNLFIDVTNSCRSARNTGMQRMTRRLFAELEQRASITPLCWNRLGHFYHRLGDREATYLRTPFQDYKGAVALPEFRGEKFPGELRRLLRRKRLDLSCETGEGDVFLVPDFFGDSRRHKLPDIIRKAGTRSVAIFHDAAMKRLGLHTRRSTRKFCEYLRALAAFDRVICISQQSRDDLMTFWKELGLHDLPETFVESWPLEFTENERSIDSDPKSNSVLCVSTFVPRKNHLALLDAAEQLWSSGLDFELKLVGAWAGNFSVFFKIRALRAKGRSLIWLKHVDDDTLHTLYRECAFTVYPSLMEGFGLPIAESLWHGKPCLCGGNGALGEVARGGGCLIVDQTNRAALANGIKSLLLDRQLYARLLTEARARKFRSWTDYIDKLLTHLELANYAGTVGTLPSRGAK